MKYLLDTCVVSDFIQGHRPTHSKIMTIKPEYICVSALTKMEIVYGLKKNPKKAKMIAGMIDDFLDCVTVLDFNAAVATQAGEIRAVLKEKGCPIGAYDLLIGATALFYQYTLVTSNTREFKRIESLKLENWRIDERAMNYSQYT